MVGHSSVLAVLLRCGLTHGLALHGAAIAPGLRCVGCTMKLADDGVLGVGVIGAGRIGLVHLEALSLCESAKAVIISNPTVSKAEAAAVKYKLDCFTADANEVTGCLIVPACSVALASDLTFGALRFDALCCGLLTSPDSAGDQPP